MVNKTAAVNSSSFNGAKELYSSFVLTHSPLKYLFAILALLVAALCQGQSYLKPNEEVILSFQTKNNKQVYLVKDKADKYMVYRFGSKDKIEFEYPAADKDSWKKFKYSSYLRGGGVANEGMDLNYVYFTNIGYRYVVYYTYVAIGEEYDIGVKVTNLKTNRTTDIKGINKTKKGTLVDFRFNNLLEIGDEIFD